MLHYVLHSEMRVMYMYNPLYIPGGARREQLLRQGAAGHQALHRVAYLCLHDVFNVRSAELPGAGRVSLRTMTTRSQGNMPGIVFNVCTLTSFTLPPHADKLQLLEIIPLLETYFCFKKHASFLTPLFVVDSVNAS